MHVSLLFNQLQLLLQEYASPQQHINASLVFIDCIAFKAVFPQKMFQMTMYLVCTQGLNCWICKQAHTCVQSSSHSAKPQVTTPCTAAVAVLLKLLVYVHHPRLCDLLPSTLSTVIVPILSHSLEWCTIDHLSVLEQHFYCNSPCCCSTEISSIQK